MTQTRAGRARIARPDGIDQCDHTVRESSIETAVPSRACEGAEYDERVERPDVMKSVDNVKYTDNFYNWATVPAAASGGSQQGHQH
jgi:hypothetical protein